MSRLSELKVTGTVLWRFSNTPITRASTILRGRTSDMFWRWRVDLRGNKSSAEPTSLEATVSDLRPHATQRAAAARNAQLFKPGCVGVIAIGFSLLLFLPRSPEQSGNDQHTNSPAQTQTAQPTERGVGNSRAWCQTFILEKLRDPDSAEFLDAIEPNFAQVGTGKYIHALTVRAANGFGGKTVSRFLCTVESKGDDSWKLLGLVEAE